MPAIDSLFILGFKDGFGVAGEFDSRAEAEKAGKELARVITNKETKVMTLAEYKGHVYQLGIEEGMKRGRSACLATMAKHVENESKNIWK